MVVIRPPLHDRKVADAEHLIADLDAAALNETPEIGVSGCIAASSAKEPLFPVLSVSTAVRLQRQCNPRCSLAYITEPIMGGS